VQTESVYASFLEQEKLLEIKNGVALLNMKNSDVHVLLEQKLFLQFYSPLEKCM
jgi:hypothetical protein